MSTDLSEALLAGPHRRVDDLEEELAGARVEDEDGSVDWLRRQVTLKRLQTPPHSNDFTLFTCNWFDLIHSLDWATLTMFTECIKVMFKKIKK